MSGFLRAHIRGAALFCYVWLMLGFFTGTVLLVGPVRWVTETLQRRGWDQSAQNLAMMGVIAAFVLTSAVLALWVVRHMSQCKTWRLRAGIPTALTLAAGLCLWAWMSPARLAGLAGGTGGSVNVGNGVEFVFGPYPERDRIAELKQQGFAGVISLQHPAVLPFEPVDISNETKAAADVGLPFIHAPMLPWIASNEASLDTIRELARTGHGRYYVHCGLGRDRANVVKRMLELEGARVAARDLEPPQTFDETDKARQILERGRITALDKDVWLIPYPNKQEFYERMLAGQVKHVTIVLDPSDPDQQRWIDQSQRLLNDFAIPFDFVPFHGDNPGQMLEIVRSIRESPRPEAVIVPYTDPYPSTQVATAVLKAYRGE